MYYSYTYIGLRSICNGCPRKWPDGSPYIFEYWYGSDPNTYYYECTYLYGPNPYNGKWMDYPCSNSINAMCQFYPKGRAEPPKVELPAKPRVGIIA